jgi:hypothetical protein
VPALERELAARLDARDRDPWSFHDAEAFYGEPRSAAHPFRARARDLARHLLLAGNRAALERIVFDVETEDLHVLAERLNDVIDGAAAPFDTLLYQGSRRERPEAKRRAFREWWQANGERLQWDAASRRFTVRPAAPAGE